MRCTKSVLFNTKSAIKAEIFAFVTSESIDEKWCKHITRSHHNKRNLPYNGICTKVIIIFHILSLLKLKLGNAPKLLHFPYCFAIGRYNKRHLCVSTIFHYFKHPSICTISTLYKGATMDKICPK